MGTRSGTTQGTTAQIQVIDDELGMDGQAAKKGFEPFFITKSVGGGTGNP